MGNIVFILHHEYKTLIYIKIGKGNEKRRDKTSQPDSTTATAATALNAACLW
jgi:hypothetical protein